MKERSFRKDGVIGLAMLCMAGLLSGCAAPRNPFASMDRHYEFIVETDPPGAEVYTRPVDGEDATRLGRTPFTFPMQLQRVPAGSQPWHRLHPRVWRARTSQHRPLSFVVLDDALQVSLPHLELRHPDYEPESFTHTWRLPPDLMHRNEAGRVWPIERQHRVKTHLRRPSNPQYYVDIEIAAPLPGSRLHTVAENNTPGKLVGPLPLEFRVPMAPERNREGNIVRWLRWTQREDQDLWNHTEDGKLIFNGYVVSDGYEPHLIANRLVARMDTSRTTQKVVVPLRPLQPARPQSSFRLEVDSLPSGAAVYRLRDDGALGQMLGKTPFELNIGMGQVLAESSPGEYVHGDWRLWSTRDLVRWTVHEDGSASFRLHCALYHEDFAVENVILPIFDLVPGHPMPTGTTLTVPLLRPEQAAAREARKMYQAVPHAPARTSHTAPGGATVSRPAASERPGFIWQAPPQTRLDDDAEQQQRPPDGARDKDTPWLRRILQRRQR